MEHEFEKCNSCTIFNGIKYEMGDGYDIFNKQEKYILAGLKPDYQHDLFVRTGYGALCFCCGEYNELDRVIEESMNFENFYNFPEKIEQGYKFVIGPGINTEYKDNKLYITDYAVYCSNYEEILNKQKHTL